MGFQYFQKERGERALRDRSNMFRRDPDAPRGTPVRRSTYVPSVNFRWVDFKLVEVFNIRMTDEGIHLAQKIRIETFLS